MIAAAAAILVPTVMLFGVVLPVHERLRVLERNVPQLRTQLVLMQEMAARSAGKGGNGATDLVMARDLVGRVEARLMAGGFRGTVTRSASGIDIVVEQAGFDSLLEDLAVLQRSEALFASESRLQAGPRPGLVSGRLRLTTGSTR